MKRMGKALKGLALVMILMLGVLGGSARATIWNPDLINPPAVYSLESGLWEYETQLVLDSKLTMGDKSSLFVTDSISLGTSGLDMRCLGRVAPRPPAPTPGIPGIFDFAGLFSGLDSNQIYSLTAAGIFATGKITINSLAIDFTGAELFDGDKFFVAATTELNQYGADGKITSYAINPNINLTVSGLDSSKFQVSFIDPPFTFGEIGSRVTYEVAYVEVSAIPEPGTLLLLGLGLLGLAGIGRKRSVL